MVESNLINIKKIQSILLKIKTSLKNQETQVDHSYKHNTSYKLSIEYMEFMKTKEEKSELINIMKNINNYIKETGLYNPEEERIIPNEYFVKLLKLNEIECSNLTYISIPSYVINSLNFQDKN